MDAALVVVPSLQVPEAVADEAAGIAAAAGEDWLIGAGAAGAVAPAAYQSLTPPCPLQAPLLDAALVVVPSLQVPEAVADEAAAAGEDWLIGAGAAGAVAPAGYQSLTPPWPLQAPLLDTALVEVPSLQVPVAPPAVPVATLASPDAAAPVFFLLFVGAVPMSELLAAGAEALASAATPYHFLTPSCPLHAPLLEAAEV